MSKSEWYQIATELQARWPNREIPDESIELWFLDLEQLPAEQVRVGILALYRDGREWCPNGAQILGKVSELHRDDADYGEAWKLARRASKKADPKEALAWLRERSPAAAEAVQEISGPQLSYQLADEATVRAQFRDIYRAVVASRKRDDVYAGLLSAGLRGLERGPRKLNSAFERALSAMPAGENA
jgi:hypothetical protein